MCANRRDFIKFVVAGAVSAGCPVDLSLVTAQTGDVKGHGAEVDGEHNQICHQVRDGKVFTRPAATARRDVVIVGGGISGLAAAYRLRQRDVLLLEKEPHWGGNAYEMEYEGNAYCTGSAFLYDEDEHAFALAKEIGLTPLPINSSDASILRGELVPDTWGEGLNKLPYPAAVRESFKKFRKELMAIDLEKRGDEFYNMPFSELMKGHAIELKQWWDAYGPSNYGARVDEASAGVGIIELQSMVKESQKDDRYTWPGGLGACTKKLAEILEAKYKDHMQAGATIVAVVPGKEDGEGGDHGDAQVHHAAHRRRPAGEAERRDGADPLHSLSGGEFDFRQAGIQPRLRYVVPGQQFHRCNGGGLGSPKTAGVQTKIQHRHLLYADEIRRSQPTADGRWRAQSGGECFK
jgi:hypothetical protein